jgi:hypothetical protein
MISHKRESFSILMSPVLLTLIAAGFHKYPFSGRLILFIVPALLLLIAEGTEYIRSKLKGGASLIVVCLIGFLFFHPLLSSTYHLLKPRVREEIKPAMNYIKEHQHEEDVLYVYNSAEPAFRYYATRLGLTKMDLVIGSYPIDSWEMNEKDIEQLRGHRRVWLLFSHSHTLSGEDHEKLFLYFSDKRGIKLDFFKSAGAAAYLYDFDESVSLNNGSAP